MYHTSVLIERFERDLITRIPFKRKYMYIYGGFALECMEACEDMWRFEIPYGSQRYYPKPEFGYWNRGDYWEVIKQGYSPGRRFGHSMVTDPENRYIYIFGGIQGNTYLDDLWRYSLDDEVWEKIETLGISSVLRKVVLWDEAEIELSMEPNERQDVDDVEYGIDGVKP
jgi:hypothetical protein